MDRGSASESHWLSEMEKSKGRQREKRKMNQKNGNKKKRARSNTSRLPDVFQEVRDKKQLVVRCGKMSGSLHRIKYDTGEKCISCKGKWYSPSQFEAIGGKGSHKRWRFNIYYRPSKGFQQVQLLKLIKSGVLPEFGHLRESFRRVTQKDKSRAKSVQNMTRKNELINALKGFPESWKRLFAKTVSIPVCGIKKNTLQRKTIQPDISSDESESVAERVKLNRRESVMSAEPVSKNTTDTVGSTASDKDPPDSHPVDASEPGVSPVVEEAVQSTDDPAGAGQLSVSASPADWQNPVASEETRETRQLQLYELLEKQFNTINNTLQSIDLSLKKLVEKQSHDTLPQYISITPAVIENPQIHSLVKQE
ncbi:uncharacterized protein si:dkey-68o6.5 isoform X2 [Rhinichthys klamathensis goyatoka]|uniref:uncharacterized protein si:dkey-68o6.5 isoform X2 n=1 Tax=Rhinichthys klamathensis goyatoka TaxID=3034132 RepID=UPI0024B55EC2|nr:uncharacterized protein si:dkey-68o6.5 isoform X2 [Rhinichthys klamathensis goyatoka]